MTKKQQMEEVAKNADPKGKGAKKDDKKGGKDAKKEEVQEEKPRDRPDPKSSENFANELREFLQIMEKKDYLYEKATEKEGSRIRSSEEIGYVSDYSELFEKELCCRLRTESVNWYAMSRSVRR